MVLPEAFCWTKFGTEAGEAADAIVGRKERERIKNGGVFLWGIGNSIKPSLLALLNLEPEPTVVFSPMLSRPAPCDVFPRQVGAWRSAIGLDGQAYELPEHTSVTSGARAAEPPQRHFALVCQRDDALLRANEEGRLDDGALRNLRTGSAIGGSQVTSVVRCADTTSERGRYRVAFKAALIHPYLVKLCDWMPLPKS